MSKRIRPPKEQLIELYCVSGISPTRIAKQYNVAVGTIYKWLVYYDIPRTHLHRPKDKPSKDQLYHWYWIENWTLPQIAKRCNVSYPAVRNWFKNFGIPRRSNSEAQRLSNNTADITPEALKRLYVDERKPQWEIAEIFGVCQTAISHAMRTYGISTRTRDDRFRGSLNPMYNHTHTPEARAKILEANRRQFSDPKARERAAINSARAIAEGKTPKTHTKVEIAFAAILDNLELEYIWQYRIKRYVYDFYLTQSNMLVEVHGTFWHADPRFYFWGNLSPTQQRNVINDKRKLNTARSLGYQTARFWEDDIYNRQERVKTILQIIT